MSAPLPQPSGFQNFNIVERAPGATKLRPMAAPGLKPMGFPRAANSDNKVYTSLRDAPPSSVGPNTVSASAAAPPAAGAPLAKPVRSTNAISAPSTTAGPSTTHVEEAPTTDELARLDSGTGTFEQRFGDAMRAIRSVIPGHRLVAVKALLQCLHEDSETTTHHLTNSATSGQLLFFVVRLLDDSNDSVRSRTVQFVDQLLRLLSGGKDSTDSDYHHVEVHLNLFGAPAVEDAVPARPRSHELTFEEISADAREDPLLALAQLQIHAKLFAALSFNDIDDVKLKWSIVANLCSSAAASSVVAKHEAIAATIRRTFDNLLVDGLMLLDQGLELAVVLIDTIRRIAMASRSLATVMFANYADVIILAVTVILSDDAELPMHRKSSGRLFCITAFAFFANCVRHGLWREELAELLVQGVELGSLRVAEAIIASRDLTSLQKSLKTLVGLDAVHWIACNASLMDNVAELKRVDGPALQMVTSLHAIATWFSTATIETLTVGDATPVRLITSLEALVKQIAGSSAVQSFTQAFSPNLGSPLVMVNFGAVQHGRIRLLDALAALLPGLRKNVAGFVVAACEGLAVTVIDSPRLHIKLLNQHAHAKRRWLGSAVAAAVELLRMPRLFNDSDDAPRTSLLLSAAVACMSLVTQTQHALDAVEDLVDRIVVPPISVGLSTSAATTDSSRQVLVETISDAVRGFVDSENPPPGMQTAIRLPWFVSGGYVEASLEPSVTLTNSPVWPAWLRWLLSTLTIRLLPMPSPSHLPVLALCFGLHLVKRMTPRTASQYTSVGAAVVSAMINEDYDAESRITANDLMPLFESMCESCDSDQNASTPHFWFMVVSILSSRFDPAVKVSCIGAWVRNHALCRQTNQLTLEAQRIPEFAKAWNDIPWSKFCGIWTGNDAIQLIDVVAEAASFATSDEIQPLLRICAAIIHDVRVNRSAFERDVLDEVVASQLGHVDLPQVEPGRDTSLLSVLVGSALDDVE